MNKSALLLAEKTNYLNKDIQYLSNVNIVEWDIHAAGFSALKFRKLLPEKTLEEWSKLDKHTRTVREGLLQKERPDIAKAILDTLADARQAFIYANNISSESILSIKKDALFLINQKPKVSVIKEFEFRPKGEYTSYLYINGKEFYYSSKTDSLDIKGLSEESKELQKDYLLKDIAKILRTTERVGRNQIFETLKQYRSKYLNRQLSADTYRSLDEEGLFRIGNYTFKNISDDMVEYLDISQNYVNYLLPLFNAIL